MSQHVLHHGLLDLGIRGMHSLELRALTTTNNQLHLHLQAATDFLVCRAVWIASFQRGLCAATQ